jgi:hypothetical protein
VVQRQRARQRSGPQRTTRPAGVGGGDLSAQRLGVVSGSSNPRRRVAGPDSGGHAVGQAGRRQVVRERIGAPSRPAAGVATARPAPQAPGRRHGERLDSLGGAPRIAGFGRIPSPQPEIEPVTFFSVNGATIVRVSSCSRRTGDSIWKPYAPTASNTAWRSWATVS